MSYLARLKQPETEKGATCAADKTHETSSEGFVGTAGGHVSALESELRGFLARELPEDHPDFSEALAIALLDPAAAFSALRQPGDEP